MGAFQDKCFSTLIQISPSVYINTVHKGEKYQELEFNLRYAFFRLTCNQTLLLYNINDCLNN